MGKHKYKEEKFTLRKETEAERTARAEACLAKVQKHLQEDDCEMSCALTISDSGVIKGHVKIQCSPMPHMIKENK